MNRWFGGVLMAALAAMAAQGLATETDVATELAVVPPRHRVALMAVPAAGASVVAPERILRLEAWRGLLLDEGVLLDADAWATARDLVLTRLAASDVLRPSELSSAATGVAPDLLLMARFVAGSGASGVELRLVEAEGGYISAAASARAADMAAAIDEAIRTLEGEAALLPWRCRVTSVDGPRAIVRRGFVDGLREGLRFVGYRMQVTNAIPPGVSIEETIMLHGTRAGDYEVVHVGRLVSRIEPIGDAPALAVGDILEIPEIRLPDRPRASRGRRLWDRIYSRP